jgi:hypothetical protein
MVGESQEQQRSGWPTTAEPGGGEWEPNSREIRMSNKAAFNEFVGHVEQRMLEIGCDRDFDIHPEKPWLLWDGETFQFDAVQARSEGMRKQVNEAVARICNGHED